MVYETSPSWVVIYGVSNLCLCLIFWVHLFVLTTDNIWLKTVYQSVEGSAKYDILLKVKRSGKEEKFKANVHKDTDGMFHVNNMVQDHS